jgi:hypothetical protein
MAERIADVGKKITAICPNSQELCSKTISDYRGKACLQMRRLRQKTSRETRVFLFKPHDRIIRLLGIMVFLEETTKEFNGML